MTVSNIGLTTVTPTTGTPAQRAEKPPAVSTDAPRSEPPRDAPNPYAGENTRAASDSEIKPAKSTGTGQIVDKRV